MTVGEVCNREVIVAAADEELAEAARLFRRHHVGNVIVVKEENGRRVPIGILTDRDLVLEVLAPEVPAESVTIGDVMSSDLLVLREDEETMEAFKRMRARGVRRAPVVGANGSLVGILAVDDVLELLAESMNDLVGLIAVEQQRERRLRES